MNKLNKKLNKKIDKEVIVHIYCFYNKISLQEGYKLNYKSIKKWYKKHSHNTKRIKRDINSKIKMDTGGD